MAEVSTLVTARGPLRHERGVVVPTPDGVLRVRSDAGLHAAKVAVSCLVQPTPFDEVMLAIGERDVFVLAILERPTDAALELTSDREVTLRATTLSLEASESLSLDGGAELDARGRTVRVAGERAESVFAEIAVFASRLESQVAQVRAVGHKLEQVFGSLSARFGSAQRRVDGPDVLHAGDISTTSEGAYQVRTKDADVRAERVMRLDGEQIHMG